MQSRPISEYIVFGTQLRFLQDAQAGWAYRGRNYIKQNVEWFLDCLDEFNLVVTKRACDELVEWTNTLDERAESHHLTDNEADNLRRIMDNLRKTLFAEANGMVAYVVSDKRIDVRKLLEGVHDLFAPGKFAALSNIAKYDFTEAGKCIAFEHTTAAAFHMLRGTESVLRGYYCKHKKRKRVNPLVWGPMIQSLRSMRVPPPVALLDHLDHIRANFRNPTQHPEKIYDIQEAQDLFSICVDVVNRMIN